MAVLRITHPVDVYVGRRLRFRRIVLGMSQDVVGKKIGISFQQVQKYERGTNRIGASRLFEFANLLNVPVSYFFEGVDSVGTESTDVPKIQNLYLCERQNDSNNEETLEIISAYHRVSSHVIRKRVINLLKIMALEDNSD